MREEGGGGSGCGCIHVHSLSPPLEGMYACNTLTLSLLSHHRWGRERENGGLKRREVALKGREGVVLLHYVYTYSSCMCVCGVVWCGVWGGSSSNTLPPLSTLTYTHTHTHTHFAPSATWLILPVVICSAQRLSHACLSIRAFARNCERLITTVAI